MELPKDIHLKIENDFLCDSPQALEVIKNGVSNNEINHPRIIRSILFLANKSIPDLIERVKDAKRDSRDVILLAEYHNDKGSKFPKQVRDFNKPFEKSEIKRK